VRSPPNHRKSCTSHRYNQPPRARVRCHERISSFSTSFQGVTITFSLLFFSNQRVLSSTLSNAQISPHVSVCLSPPIPYPLSLIFVYSSPRPCGSCQKLPDGYSTHPSLILEGDYPTTSLTGNQIFGVEDSSGSALL
jgi:hypothetical protein